MPHPQIKFGTDGWRGVIADDFTLPMCGPPRWPLPPIFTPRSAAKGLCIGYDTRFGSKAFARACADVIASTGIPVAFASDITPTPA